MNLAFAPAATVALAIVRSVVDKFRTGVNFILVLFKNLRS